MKTRTWLLPLLVSLVSVGIAASWIDAPGYTDADYYMATGVQLARGHGLSQPFIWNFLASPSDLPHPSHLYWMPLASFLAALPMPLLGTAFRVAQLPFILLTLLLPLVSARMALSLNRDENMAILSGLLASLPGFYLPFFLTTDTFIPYAWIGTGCLWLATAYVRNPSSKIVLGLGVAVGLAHLTRADGILFLVPTGIAIMRSERDRFRDLVILAAGYAFVMGPWFLRLTLVSGTPWPPGASRALWLQNYNQLFSYPASQLDPGHLLAGGIGKVIADRFNALGQNLLSLVVVTGLVVVAPLAFAGGWERRDHPLVWLSASYLAALLALMSLAFPFPGPRGGFFHSSAALLPVLWALAPGGLKRILRWASERRAWNPNVAWVRFRLGLVLLVALATGFLVWERLVAPSLDGQGWGHSYRTYREVGEILERAGADQVRAAVNNPPGFWLATGHEAVVIPDGNLDTLEQVVEDFRVNWLILDRNHPEGLEPLYESPGSSPRFELFDKLPEGAAAPVLIFRYRLRP